jgi:tRNA threonylcarbamoyladenosine biosynthesis protein TsaB
MSRLLLIETASEVCSAAIAVDGRVVSIQEDLQCASHTAVLTLQIEACCRMAGISLKALDAVGVSLGPGAYTALRVGASVAKGICYALDKPLIAVSTLEALAWASRQETADEEGTHYFVPMLDARRNEVWLAVYDQHLQEIAPAQALITENNMFEIWLETLFNTSNFNSVVLSGNGAFKQKIGSNTDKMVFSNIVKCSAAHLLALVGHKFEYQQYEAIAYFEPFYMKPPNITTSNKAVF